MVGILKVQLSEEPCIAERFEGGIDDGGEDTFFFFYCDIIQAMIFYIGECLIFIFIDLEINLPSRASVLGVRKKRINEDESLRD